LREEHEYALRVGGGEITIAPELFRSKGHVYSAGRDHVGVHTYCPDGDRARCFFPVAGRADPVHQYDKAGPVWWFQLGWYCQFCTPCNTRIWSVAVEPTGLYGYCSFLGSTGCNSTCGNVEYD